MSPSASELSPAGFDRSLRLKVTRVGGTPVPHPSPPQPLGTPGREEERRLCCDVGEKRMGSRVRGQRKPYKQQHARSSHHRPPATHTHGDSLPFPALALPARAHRLPGPGPQAQFHCLPRLVPRAPGHPQDKNLSQRLEGPTLPTPTPELSKRCRGNGCWRHSPFIHVLATPAEGKSKDKISPFHSQRRAGRGWNYTSQDAQLHIHTQTHTASPKRDLSEMRPGALHSGTCSPPRDSS